MVEQMLDLDETFGSLSDGTRRDILKRVAKKELSISEVAEPYEITFAAISKHLMILERAKLIIKRREGRQQMIHLAPDALKDASSFLENYRKFWEENLDSLEKYLARQKHGKHKR